MKKFFLNSCTTSCLRDPVSAFGDSAKAIRQERNRRIRYFIVMPHEADILLEGYPKALLL